MKITAITCVKNEGPFLLEWVLMLRALGVSRFLVYSNDCDDGTDRMLDLLHRRGAVVHLPNPAQGRTYQMEALQHARHQPVVRGADWLWVSDVDEFPSIRVARHGFADLIAACGTPDAISLSFRYFANGGVARFEDRPVIAQFDRTHPADSWNGGPMAEVKTLFRADLPLRYIGAHRPFLAGVNGVRWTDGSGRAVPRAFLDGADKAFKRQFPAAGARDFASLNHYALRSADSYLVKTNRGDVNRPNRAFDLDYWKARNTATLRDTGIQRHLPALGRAMARVLADPQIAACHRACVAAHRARRDALLHDPAMRELYDQLIAADHARASA